ncbi:hypothetical protein EJ02DRAFT_461061, partial [Clathrospora elynae]
MGEFWLQIHLVFNWISLIIVLLCCLFWLVFLPAFKLIKADVIVVAAGINKCANCFIYTAC